MGKAIVSHGTFVQTCIQSPMFHYIIKSHELYLVKVLFQKHGRIFRNMPILSNSHHYPLFMLFINGGKFVVIVTHHSMLTSVHYEMIPLYPNICYKNHHVHQSRATKITKSASCTKFARPWPGDCAFGAPAWAINNHRSGKKMAIILIGSDDPQANSGVLYFRILSGQIWSL